MMAEKTMAERTHSGVDGTEVSGTPETTSIKENASTTDVSQAQPHRPVPLSYKILSILLVSGIGFGSHWSSGVTGAMKSTIKKVRQVKSNAQAAP